MSLQALILFIETLSLVSQLMIQTSPTQHRLNPSSSLRQQLRRIVTSNQLRSRRENSLSRFRLKEVESLLLKQTTLNSLSRRQLNQVLAARETAVLEESVLFSMIETRKMKLQQVFQSSIGTLQLDEKVIPKSQDSTRCIAYGKSNSPLDKLKSLTVHSTGAHARRSAQQPSVKIRMNQEALAKRMMMMALNCSRLKTSSPHFYRVFVL